MFDRKHLSPEEREEYDALLYEAGYDDSGKRRPSSEIADRMVAMLAAAVQGRRPWAQYMIDDDARAGHLSRWRRWNKAKVVIWFNDHEVLVPRGAAMGVRRKEAETGATYWQQVAWDEMDWDEVTETMKHAHVRIASEKLTVAIAVRLLALRNAAPDSTGPADACERLGIGFAAFLAGEQDVA